MTSNSDKGAISELIALSWMMREGHWAFRNQSPNGPADIIVMNRLTYELSMYDVKSAYYTPTTNKELKLLASPLSKDQIASGIKRLVVTPEGDCFIDDGLSVHIDRR